MPTMFAPLVGERIAVGWKPRCLSGSTWSSVLPSSVLARFSSTVTTFAVDHLHHRDLRAIDVLLALHTACSSAPSGSPVDTATCLPSRSFGVFRFDSASDTTENPVEFRRRHHLLDVRALRGGRDDRRRVRHAERVGPGGDDLHGVGRAVASLIVRSMPPAAGNPRSFPAVMARAGRPGTSCRAQRDRALVPALWRSPTAGEHEAESPGG